MQGFVNYKIVRDLMRTSAGLVQNTVYRCRRQGVISNKQGEIKIKKRSGG